jgi:hypothetical protein
MSRCVLTFDWYCMCDIYFDLEWTIIMHLYRNRGSGKKIHVIYVLK